MCSFSFKNLQELEKSNLKQIVMHKKHVQVSILNAKVKDRGIKGIYQTLSKG